MDKSGYCPPLPQPLWQTQKVRRDGCTLGTQSGCETPLCKPGTPCLQALSGDWSHPSEGHLGSLEKDDSSDATQSCHTCPLSRLSQGSHPYCLHSHRGHELSKAHQQVRGMTGLGSGAT